MSTQFLSDALKGGPGSGPHAGSDQAAAEKASTAKEHDAAATYHDKQSVKFYAQKDGDRGSLHDSAAQAHRGAAEGLRGGDMASGVNSHAAQEESKLARGWIGKSFDRSFKSLATAISNRVEELQNETELKSSILLIESALEVCSTKSLLGPEVEHTASFERALGLLREGKSLPEDLFERVNGALGLYVKGGPGSGPHPSGGTKDNNIPKGGHKEGDRVKVRGNMGRGAVFNEGKRGEIVGSYGNSHEVEFSGGGKQPYTASFHESDLHNLSRK